MWTDTFFQFETADVNNDQLLSTEEFFNLVTEGTTIRSDKIQYLLTKRQDPTSPSAEKSSEVMSWRMIWTILYGIPSIIRWWTTKSIALVQHVRPSLEGATKPVWLSLKLVMHHLAMNGHRDIIDKSAQDKLQKSKKWLIYVQDREVRSDIRMCFPPVHIMTLWHFDTR